jgi:hypothetical protein
LGVYSVNAVRSAGRVASFRVVIIRLSQRAGRILRSAAERVRGDRHLGASASPPWRGGGDEVVEGVDDGVTGFEVGIVPDAGKDH